jgi:signal transduction histidine kinase
LAEPSRKPGSELWLKGVTSAIIVVIAFLAISLRIRLWSVHPGMLLAHMLNRPSFWVVALLSVLIGLAFGQIKGNFRPLVAILAVVILFILILGTELFFVTRGAPE